MDDSTDLRGLERRQVLGGMAAVGMAAPLLAACGSEKEVGVVDAPDPTGTSSDAGPSPSQGGGGALVAAADVPVGGGVVLDDQKIVVTQPAQGEFKAFTAVCTHQGCVVGSVQDNVIHCPCHGSAFSAEDGSVVNGPATGALTAVEVQVKGGKVVES